MADLYCNECKGFIEKRRLFVTCYECKMQICFKCANLQNKGKLNIACFCYQCLMSMFPFQFLNNFELQNMFSTKTDVMRQLNKLDCLQALDSNLNLINVNSKYRSVDWLNRHYDTYNDLGISVIHFNVRCIIKNKQKIEELLYDLNKYPDITAISETKLNDDCNLGQASIQQGYHLLNVNSNSNAGGVALYVSQKLNYIRKPELSFVSPDSENLFVEISLNQKAKNIRCNFPSTPK